MVENFHDCAHCTIDNHIMVLYHNCTIHINNECKDNNKYRINTVSLLIQLRIQLQAQLQHSIETAVVATRITTATGRGGGIISGTNISKLTLIKTKNRPRTDKSLGFLDFQYFYIYKQLRFPFLLCHSSIGSTNLFSLLNLN